MNLLWQANFTNPRLPYGRIIKIYIKKTPKAQEARNVSLLLRKCSRTFNSHRSIQGSIQPPLIAQGAKYCEYWACLDWLVTSAVWSVPVCVSGSAVIWTASRKQPKTDLGEKAMRKNQINLSAFPPKIKSWTIDILPGSFMQPGCAWAELTRWVNIRPVSVVS